MQGPRARHGDNTAHPFGDRLFGDDFAETDLPRVRQMRSAAQFDAELAHGHDADRIGIFFAEEGHRVELFRLFQSRDAGRNGRSFRDAGVDFVLDFEDFLGRQGPLVGEVETELVLLDFRPALCRRFAQRFAQRVVQQVRRRVGAANGARGVRCRRWPSASGRLEPALL